MNLRPAGASIPGCETDFVVLGAGYQSHPRLFIGECKTGQEITQADVDHLLAVARAFANTPIRVFVVFAKLSTFTEAETARLKSAKESGFSDIILLSERELEAEFTYDWARETLGLVLSRDVEGMVRATELIYFGEGPPG